MRGMGQPAYRGRQIAEWIYRKSAGSIEEMVNLPKDLRQKLAESHTISPLHVADHQKSSDGVDKLLVHQGDDEVYECVLLPYRDRVSCCLSSQVGCPMGCKFCATGLGGFDRNLSTAEIVSQYLLLQGLSERRISHVVFMGMGEPLLNLDALLPALDILTEEVGLSRRHITVSTVGLVPQMKELADKAGPITLALSLHSPFDEIRSSLMPVNDKWPVREAMDALRHHHQVNGRKITVEYLLISEVNDSRPEAKALAELVRGIPHVVNVIPFNWVDTGEGYSRPSRGRVDEFLKTLRDAGANATEREERGHDIAAACGQLAGAHTGRFAKREGLSAIPSA